MPAAGEEQCEAVPAKGFTVVLRHAFAVAVHEAEVELRGGVTLSSEAAQSGHVRRVLAADECYYGQRRWCMNRCKRAR